MDPFHPSFYRIYMSNKNTSEILQISIPMKFMRIYLQLRSNMCICKSPPFSSWELNIKDMEKLFWNLNQTISSNFSPFDNFFRKTRWDNLQGGINLMKSIDVMPCKQLNNPSTLHPSLSLSLSLSLRSLKCFFIFPVIFLYTKSVLQRIEYFF